MKYKYSDDVNKRLYKAVKNFNETRNRDIKKVGRGMIPEHLYVRTIKERFAGKPKADLMKEIRLIESYNKLGKERRKKVSKYSPISKWELQYFRVRIPEAKEFYDKEIAELEKIIGDKPAYFLRHHERLNTLKAQRIKLENDLEMLDEQEIKSIRRYIANSQRSELIKEQGYRTFLAQMDRIMEQCGYSQADIDKIYEKLNTLTPNEFFEMYRQEPLIDKLYETIGSPKNQGEYMLMTSEVTAKKRIESFVRRLDTLIAEAKNHE